MLAKNILRKSIWEEQK